MKGLTLAAVVAAALTGLPSDGVSAQEHRSHAADTPSRDAVGRDSTNHGAVDHGTVHAAPPEGTANYLTLNVAVSDTELQPATLFVPARRPVQLMLRNRGSTEHHYRVVGLVPDDLMWISRTAPAVPVDAPDDDHSRHHNRQMHRARAPSPAGIRPTGTEVHAYVSVPGEIDIVLFTASQVGRFVVQCDLHREQLGTLAVFDEPDPASDAVASSLQGPGLARALTRALGSVDYPEAEGVQVEATYATAEYITQALGVGAAATLQPDRDIAFLLTERTHISNLPRSRAEPQLYVDGRLVPLVGSKVMTDSVHHRATFYRFERNEGFGSGHQVMTLRLPSGPEATWHLPLVTPTMANASGGPTGLGEQWGLILALLGGMVAAMWPCLFQLTVYFIPALAGVAMQDANSVSGSRRRRQVLSAACYFILGFTLVYTATGALIGLAAQRLGENAQFEVWQRYFSMAAGVVVIGLSLRVAAKARAPLVCRMPLLSRMSRSSGPATRAEMMLAGLAFATGCMTCFGSALVVGMVVYVGLAQSALYGALVLFLFSLGMGIPLVLAALAMARALPLLLKLETAVPWMGLISAGLMAGFGVLLISGNYMLVSEWTFRVVNGSAALAGGSINATLAAALTLGAGGAAWVIARSKASTRPSAEGL